MPQITSWEVHHRHRPRRPSGNDGYFERMARVIFTTGSWADLDKKWQAIKEAFAGFEVEKVAAYGEPEIAAIMGNPGVVQNLPRVKAVIENARAIEKIIDEFGSFELYLRALRRRTGGEARIVDDISTRFARLGKNTAVVFLYAVGEDLPDSIKEWQERHGGAKP